MTDDTAAFNDRIKTMCAFVQARCDEDEIWAREASRFSAEPDREGHTVPDLPNGMHWRWGYGDQWAEVVPDMSIDPQMNKLPDPDGWYSVTLVSVETWQWEHAHGRVWEMHEQVIDGSEVRTAAAGHIARHDPARVLREVAAVCMQPPFTVDGVRAAVRELHGADGQEGIVWHHPDGRMAKLKARDFPRTEG